MNQQVSEPSLDAIALMATGADLAICWACSMLHGLQGFLPHLSGDVGGHQHVAELALSKTALTLVSNKRIKKVGRALPTSSNSPAEQTGERNSQPSKL